MKSINRFWTTIVVAGILIMGASVLWNLTQSFSGADNDFNENIEQFDSSVLLPDFIEEHIIDSEVIVNPIL